MVNVILHARGAEDALELARRRHPGVTFTTCDTYDGLEPMISDTGAEIVYSIRFDGTPAFPRAALVESETVRWVSVGGSGTDHLATWDPAHVTVTNAAGVAADMMAEYTIGALLHFSLDLPGFRAAQARRQWGAGRVKPIEGQHLLILGLGQTGRAIARRAKAMGLQVTGMRARPQPTDHVDRVIAEAELDAVLGEVDAIAVCVPLLDSTRELLNKARIDVLKPGAVLVDVSRGGVVDQAALADALASGRLGGAALDVFEVEPLPEDSPFWAMENVIVTPHSSSVYDGWALKSVDMFCDNLTRYLEGAPLQNIVDPVRGY
ncbi:MAG: D-2-hydroxyacid dehydrogenase [Pseudomonadota bacterium]